MSSIKVFVYGTLMEGSGNNRTLGAHAKLLGRGYIRGYSMVDLGAFPGIVYAGNAPITPLAHNFWHEGEGLVHGELWEIDYSALEQVDRLEGTPHFYKRDTCYVSLGSPGLESELFYSDRDQWFKQCAQEAFTYIYQCVGGDKRGRGIPCGDWRKHVKTIREIRIGLAKSRAEKCL